MQLKMLIKKPSIPLLLLLILIAEEYFLLFAIALELTSLNGQHLIVGFTPSVSLFVPY